MAVKHGATIRTNAEVVEIVCERGRAVGARTADGNTFYAPVFSVCMHLCMYRIHVIVFKSIYSSMILKCSSYQCMYVLYVCVCDMLGYRLQLHTVSHYDGAAAARGASRGI